MTTRDRFVDRLVDVSDKAGRYHIKTPVPPKLDGLAADIQVVQKCLHSGQRSQLKTEAQLAFARLVSRLEP